MAGHTMYAISQINKPKCIVTDRIFAGRVSLYVFGSGFMREEDCQLR